MHPVQFTPIRSYVFLAALLVPVSWSLGQEVKVKAPEGRSTGHQPADPTLDALVAAHNRVRAEHKLPPLKANARLTQAARSHTRDIAERGQLSHDGSDGSDAATRIKRAGYVRKSYAENVAAGQETVEEVMRTWVESPAHRENILGDYTEMGAAVARSADGQNYWCVDFGLPMPGVDPVKSPAAMIAALNRTRSDAKKPSLKTDTRLARVADRFAREAASRKSLDGKNSDGETPFDVLKSQGSQPRRFGMTLASGEGDTAKVLAAWLERPEDREALLSRFDHVGVGVATDSDGIPYWVILLTQSAGR
jgi:uncharacterized protein YkwD